MGRALRALSLLVVTTLVAAFGQTTSPPADAGAWQVQLQRYLPLLGHRNWILIVDSAYPLQSSAGVDTIETGADQIEVTRYVLDAISRSIHVRPDIMMDAELPFVPEEDAPGVTQYRTDIATLLSGTSVESVPHEELIGRIDQAGQTMRVLVLKTNMTVPYSSIFLHLNCRYWSDDAEKRLRARMASGASPGTD